MNMTEYDTPSHNLCRGGWGAHKRGFRVFLGIFFQERLPLVAGAACRTWATVLLLTALAASEPHHGLGCATV